MIKIRHIRQLWKNLDTVPENFDFTIDFTRMQYQPDLSISTQKSIFSNRI